jgi:hypothetical protein
MKLLRQSALIVITIFVTSFISSCDDRYGRRQPLVSKDPTTLEQLDGDDVQFPYKADDLRRSAILENNPRLELGMTGDEVLKVMGNPDFAMVLAHAFDKAYGYSWQYCLARRYPRAPDDSDRFVEVFFDTSGRVSDILRRLE